MVLDTHGSENNEPWYTW